MYYLNNNLLRKVFLTMAVSNSIFSTSKKDIRTVLSANASLDSGVMSSDEEKIFNTYRYWEPFSVPMQPIIEKNGSESSVSAPGTKSLFNQFNAVYTYGAFREDANMPLLDSPESRKNMRRTHACTIKDLVDASAAGKLGRQIYNYSDFAYCKHLGKIPNNYLITLRRFPAPCGDKIDKRFYMSDIEDEIQNHLPDTGRLVTWMGTPGNEMSNILKYTYGMQWEDQTAEITEQEVGEGGTLQSLFNMSNSKYRTQVMQGMANVGLAGSSMMAGMVGNMSGEKAYNPADWQRMSADSTKVYGPVDVIDTTKKRKRGLTFEQKFTLTFDYELRSYYGVNGKAALIDLLGNILATTYTLGTFWGGERRFVGAAQSNIFNNLPIFKLADKGGLNNPSAVLNALMDSVSDGAKAFSNGVQGETTIEKIKNLAKDIGGMLLGGVLNKLGRPQKFAMASLLSGANVGCWHLTIGNPMSPILEIGNLVCTGAEIEHYGPLGEDDIPVGLRVKVNLEHGRPRDMMGIEQMYGRGDSRFYAPMGDEIMQMYKGAESITKKKGAADKKVNQDKINNSTLSTQDAVTATAVATEAEQVQPNNQIHSDAIKNLNRYFGMKERDMIITASSESLYGSEKHKNDHAKKK